jgi:DNA repair protein RadC
MQPFTIKSWAEDDRPREKMQLKGKSALSDAELIAILLGSGTRSKSAVQLAQEMLQVADNDLNKFGKWNATELQKFKGIGEAKAITLLAAIELGRRRKETEQQKQTKIGSSKCSSQLLSPYFEDLDHEEFYVIFLSRANAVIKTKCISIGGLTGTVADGKVIFKYALELNSCGIILAHNHPSGKLLASEQDIRLTKSLRQFGELIGILVLDHLIFAGKGYLSFADEGLM